MRTTRIRVPNAPSRRRAVAAGRRAAREDVERIGLATWIFCAFVVSYLLHFGTRWPVLGLIRIDLILGAASVAAALFQSKGGGVDRGKPPMSEQTKWLLLLVGYMAISLPFVQWPGSVLRHGVEPFAKAIFFFVLAASALRNQRQIVLLLSVFVAAQTVRVLEPLYLNLTQGYWGSVTSIGDWRMMDRLAGAPSDVVNPNGLAYIIVTTLPFLHFVIATRSRIGRGLYLLLIPAYLYTLLLTNSRSGLIVLVFTIGVIAWLSKARVVVAGGLLVVLVIGIVGLSDTQVDRFRSIYSTSAGGAATAEGRIDGVIQDLKVAFRRPLLGHGLGTSVEANAHGRGKAQVSHNLITEVLQELGLIGLGIFLAFLWSAFRSSLNSSRAVAESMESDRALMNVARALLVTMSAGGVFSLASYGLSEFYWYLWAGLSVATARLLADRSLDCRVGARVAA